MLFREAFGEIVREQRLARGLIMRAISDKGFISLGYLSEIERGHKDPSSEVIASVAEGLGVPAHLLVIEAGFRMANNQIPDTAEKLFEKSNEWLGQYSDLVV